MVFEICEKNAFGNMFTAWCNLSVIFRNENVRLSNLLVSMNEFMQPIMSRPKGKNFQILESIDGSVLSMELLKTLSVPYTFIPTRTLFPIRIILYLYQRGSISRKEYWYNYLLWIQKISVSMDLLPGICKDMSPLKSKVKNIFLT